MSTSDSLDGFYVAYLAGTDGNGALMLVLMAGKVVGADPFGVRVDGTYAKVAEGGYEAKLTISAPPDGILIQGVNTGPSGITYELRTKLPDDLERPEFIEVRTPLGPVNARFKKLRGLFNE